MRPLRVLSITLAIGVTLFPSFAAGQAPDGCPKLAPRAGSPSWPAGPGGGEFDVVHFGEGHWNEGQGPKTMPILVQDIVSYRPDFVAFSSDMADTGTVDRLACFSLIMRPLQEARIPWFDSPGNHDRVPITGPGGLVNGDIQMWREVFAAMPAPWGDALTKKGFVVPEAEPSDGKGASTHYYFDYGKPKPVVRLIVLDNSMHSLTTSDTDQYPAIGAGQADPSQLAFLERTAADAQERGLLAFVMMHQPTQDPRDPTNVHFTSVIHTMGKGASPDNVLFDQIASTTGVDAVLLGHIQGNALYQVAETTYYIDGGGGGSPYARSEVGTDTGYYYGFRVLRMFKTPKSSNFRTYFVPLVDKIEISGTKEVAVGKTIALEATAIQPFDPDLPPRFGGAPNAAIELELRPPDAGIFTASVPQLAYMWKTSNPMVLRPVIDKDLDPTDDPAFNPRVMTTTGRFEALRPGRATITIMSGTHSASITVVVTS